MPLARLAAVAAGCALLAGCTANVENGRGSLASTGSTATSAGTSHGAAPAAGARARFGHCGSGIDLGEHSAPPQFEVQCAKLAVPLDYAQPNGKQISVALVRLHDRENGHPDGSLLVDPGGPGGSGVQFAMELAGALPAAVAEHYDLIGFDPRGVGSSTPIRCESDRQKDEFNAASPDIRTAAGFTSAKKMAIAVARECSAKYGAALAQFDTVQTAKDMDRIRQAVGDAELNYLGFSYGTELGAQYAHLFPSHVGAMVLDGAVDPLTNDITSFAQQLNGFEQAFDQFARWCTGHDPCRSLGDPRSAVYRLAAKARTAPIPSTADPRKATPALVDLGVLSALYSQSFWPVLAQALIAARGGDSSGLLQLADVYSERTNGHYTNLADANTTISCNNAKPGPTDAQIRALGASWAKRFPMFGLWSAETLFNCQQWQPDRTVPPRPTAPDAAHKVLVIGNLHDPATPYQGAKDLTRTLGDAELLTWDGEGHTSYLQGSSCIDDYVDAYLVHGTLPPDGKTCPQ